MLTNLKKALEQILFSVQVLFLVRLIQQIQHGIINKLRCYLKTIVGF